MDCNASERKFLLSTAQWQSLDPEVTMTIGLLIFSNFRTEVALRRARTLIRG